MNVCDALTIRSIGLGLELSKLLLARGHKVFATVRSAPSPGTFPEQINVIKDIDVGEEDAGAKLVAGLDGAKLDLTIINAALFKAEVRPREGPSREPVETDAVICADL